MSFTCMVASEQLSIIRIIVCAGVGGDKQGVIGKGPREEFNSRWC